MLLATGDDNAASIWNVLSSTTWPSTPHVTFYGHSDSIYGGAFLGDESHVITGSAGRLCIWRTSDAVQTANIEGGYVRYSIPISIIFSFFLLCSCVHCRIMLHQATLHSVLPMVTLDWCKLLLILHHLLPLKLPHVRIVKLLLKLLLKVPLKRIISCSPAARVSASGWRRRRLKRLKS